MFIADGTYRFERGSVSNSFGDDVDVPEKIVARGVPGALAEKNRMRSDGGTMVVVAVLTGRFSAGLDVQLGDRAVNEQSGDKYVVDALPSSLGMMRAMSDKLVELKRVTAK
jgi:hypothetical protein